MNAIKKFGPWTIRIIISFVFFLSAIAKLYPKPSYALTYFEVHQLEPMGISIEIAHYLSRLLIGVEFAIGILLLLPFHIKRIIIPATIFTDLILMKIYRIKQIIGNSGNTIASEGIDANYYDMLNYAVFALIHLGVK